MLGDSFSAALSSLLGMEVTTSKDLKERCVRALSDVGASQEFCLFFADVLQCEYDVNSNVYRIHQTLTPESNSTTPSPSQTPPQKRISKVIRDPPALLKCVQELTKKYNGWKGTIEALSQRSNEIPPLYLNSEKVSKSKVVTALCSLQTKEIQLDAGDEITITDISQPNRLKVKNSRGEEGFVPSLCCLLPSPDKNALSATERLRILLLAAWTESAKKVSQNLMDCLTRYSKQMLQDWKIYNPTDPNIPKERVNRRFKRLNDTITKHSPNWDLTKLHNALYSLEKEIGSASITTNSDIKTMVETIASLDKCVLCFQMLAKQLYLYRKEMESAKRPIRIIDDLSKFRRVRKNRSYKYIEITTTLENVETKEEFVYNNTSIASKDTLDGWNKQKLDDINKRNEEEKWRADKEREEKIMKWELERQRMIEATTNRKTNENIDPKNFNGAGQNGLNNSTATTTTTEINIEQSNRVQRELQQSTMSTGEGIVEEMVQAESASTAESSAMMDTVEEEEFMNVGGGEETQIVQAEQITTCDVEEETKIVIKGVIDPRNGKQISIQEAVAAGIVDYSTGQYCHPGTGESVCIPEAMSDGRIKVETVRVTAHKEETKAIGLITIKSMIDKRHYNIMKVIDANSKKSYGMMQARKRGILDLKTNHYVNTKTKERMPLDEAIESGLVVVDFESENEEPEFETKTYAINYVVDQKMKRKVPFYEAVQIGLINAATGNYVNNLTGERIYVADAIDKGFLKGREVEDAFGLNIEAENKVVVQRIGKIRKNVLRSMEVISAFRRAAHDQ